MTLLHNPNTLKESSSRRNVPQAVSSEQLYDHYAPLVYSIVSKFIADKQKAEETLVEVFVHLHKHFPPDEIAKKTFGVWLINTSRNMALNRLCAMQYNYGCDENFEGLPLGEKTVFALYYFRSYSLMQISEVLHLQLRVCEKLLHNAEAKQSR